MKIALTSFFFLLYSLVQAQHGEKEHATENHEEENFKHKVALFSGTSWVPEGRNPETGEKETILAPTWGYAYEYWFAPKWAIGSYGDIELINIVIQQSDGDDLKRENVLVFTLGSTYKITPRWTTYIGGGVEVDAHHTIGVGRLTTEYALVEHQGWEGAVSFSYLLKEHYNVLSLGLVLAKKF